MDCKVGETFDSLVMPYSASQGIDINTSDSNPPMKNINASMQSVCCGDTSNATPTGQKPKFNLRINMETKQKAPAPSPQDWMLRLITAVVGLGGAKYCQPPIPAPQTQTLEPYILIDPPNNSSSTILPDATNVIPRAENYATANDIVAEWRKAGTNGRGQAILTLRNPLKPTNLRYEDIREEGHKLGEGVSGVVYKVEDRHHKKYAKKVILPGREVEQQIKAELLALYSVLPCPNIVRLHQAFFVNGKFSIIMEYLDRGSLADVMKRAEDLHLGSLPNDALLCILYQVLKGLDALHNAQSLEGRLRPRIHRDLKPENILLNSEGMVKLSDFGCMKHCTDTLGWAKTFLGTGIYMSPERLLGEVYTTSADIWSLGVVAYKCATGQDLYPSGSRPFFELLKIVQAPIIIPEAVNPQIRDFICKCLHQDPFERPSAHGLLEDELLVCIDHMGPLKRWIQVFNAHDSM